VTRGVPGSGTLNPHGTLARYKAGCGCDLCRDANRRVHTLFLLDREPRTLPAVGTRRRMRALAAIGWSCAALAREMGCSPSMVSQIQHGPAPVVRRATARSVALVYERLSMRIPPDEDARTRLSAARKGWAPPLAWDDIDDPDASPRTSGPSTDDVDPVVIERLSMGHRVAIEGRDRPAVVAALAARGLSDGRIADLLGVWPETVLRARRRHNIPSSWRAAS
jgi:predicted transcriptional regulator